MEAFERVYNTIGVIRLGVELSKILRKQANEIADMDERFKQLVHEIGETTTALADAQDLLADERTKTAECVLNPQGFDDLMGFFKRCNSAFREVIELVAQDGKMAKAMVDEFARKVEKACAENLEAKYELHLSLCSTEHLRWPQRLCRIGELVSTFELQKLYTLLFLSVAKLARERKRVKLL